VHRFGSLKESSLVGFLNEQDSLTMDMESWMDYFASLKADAVQLNSGDIGLVVLAKGYR
jgi:hypothetical protein